MTRPWIILLMALLVGAPGTAYPFACFVHVSTPPFRVANKLLELAGALI